MIHKEDLRIGNLVFCTEEDRRIVPITAINTDMHIGIPDIDYSESNDYVECGYLEGVELTEDILVKCNIERKGQFLYFKGYGNLYCIYMSKSGAMLELQDYSNKIPIRFLHEFQNWYKLLTGQELEIKL